MMWQFTLAASGVIGAPPVAAGLADAPVADGTCVAPSGCTAVGEFAPPPPSKAMTAAITSPSTTGRAKKVANRAARLPSRRRRHADRRLPAIKPTSTYAACPQRRRLDQAGGRR